MKYFVRMIWRTVRALRATPLLLLPAGLSAQNGVTVSNLAVDAGTVTFNVSWKNTGMPAVWSDTVWVFVDYNNAGTMERLPLAAGATLTATSPGGEVAYEGGNNKGIWVIGNARSAGSFSATVKLCTDAMHSVSAGACAYASNYPPVGKYTTPADISFTGTPPYTIVIKKDAGGTTETRQSNSPFTVPAGYTVQSFTDKTGAPGTLIYLPPPNAASTQTWTYGALTWSDRIVGEHSGCSLVTALSTKAPATLPAQYKINSDSGVERYYYNWKCALTVCPSGWSLPTDAQLSTLLHGSPYKHWYNIWGDGGYAREDEMDYVNSQARYWSSTPNAGLDGYAWYLYISSANQHVLSNVPMQYGLQVRCVMD
jgi:hypothetical protein